VRGWHETTLGEICNLVTDGKHGDCRNEENSGYYFISAKDVREGRIHYEQARQIVQDDFAETHRRTDLRPGDLLITNSGTIGRMAIAADDERTPTTTFQKSVAILKPKSGEVSSRFLYYYLNANLAALIHPAAGAAQKNLLLGDIRRFRLKKPGLAEQERIVDAISPYDDLIVNNRRRIALLEEAARMLYREWFVHFRFPGHEHVKIIDGLPEGWEWTTLGQVAETNSASYGAKELPEQINYIDISSVAEGRIVSTATLSSIEAPGRARRKARDGDIIWSNVRPNLRAYALVLQPEETDVFSTGFTVLSGKRVPFSWLYLFVTTDNFVGHLVNHATGAGYPAVRPDDFERAAVMLPSRGLLKHFHEATEPNFRLISKLEQQNQKLAQARHLLLPRLMNGEIPV
jgi:type I restriction enzyme S subunit